MGTHPIFESDFDCLTEKKREITPRKNAGDYYGRRETAKNPKSGCGAVEVLLEATSGLHRDGGQTARGDQGQGHGAVLCRDVRRVGSNNRQETTKRAERKEQGATGRARQESLRCRGARGRARVARGDH